MLRSLQVSNISDAGYMGIGKTVAYLTPLLQHPSKNSHATLLTLFMNAVAEMVEQTKGAESLELEMKRVLQYMPLQRMPSKFSNGDPQLTVRISALPLVRDGDKFFDR